MRLFVFSFTAVCGPQVIKADEPRSIIYAVIVHEVYFALSLELPAEWALSELGEAGSSVSYCTGEVGCPISTAGTLGL
jgi:hypothetical protein